MSSFIILISLFYTCLLNICPQLGTVIWERKEDGSYGTCNQYINPACQHTLDWWRLKWLACRWDCLPEINETFVKSVKHYTSYRFTDYHKEPINSKISSNTSFKFVHKQLINSKTYNTSCKLVDYTNNRWNKNNS